MEINKIKSIKLSLMQSQGEMNKKRKTNYIVKASAVMEMNEIVEKTIEEHGLDEVLNYVYNDLLEANKDKVDSVGIWLVYDGKEYENSIKLQTLNDMKQLSDEEIYPIYELFKLLKEKLTK